MYKYGKKTDDYKTEVWGKKKKSLPGKQSLTFFFPLLILNKAVCEFEPRETFIKIN